MKGVEDEHQLCQSERRRPMRGAMESLVLAGEAGGERVLLLFAFGEIKGIDFLIIKDRLPIMLSHVIYITL